MFRYEKFLRVFWCGSRSIGTKAVLAFLAFTSATSFPLLAASSALQWTQTPSTQAWGCSFGITMDAAGNLYTVGASDGTVFGVPVSSGQYYVAKYTRDGDLAWKNQWAGSGGVFGVAADSAGNVFMADGGLEKKFSESGVLLWQTDVQLFGQHVAVDTTGNSYICGMSGTGYPSVSKVDSSGGLLWTSQLPSPGTGWAVAVDVHGNAVMTGHSNYDVATCTQLGYAAEFDTAGNLLWNKQYGSVGTYTDVTSVAVDGYGGIYMTGNIGSNRRHAFVKYDQSGNQQWARDISYDGHCNSIASDPNVAVYVSTGNSIEKYDLSGNRVDQFAMPMDVFALAYSAGAFGIAGIGGPGPLMDSYVSCYSVPEPSSLVLLGIGAASLLAYAWRWRRQVA